MLKQVSGVVFVGLAMALAGCGGGGGDVAAMTVNPTEQLYTCAPGVAVNGAVSEHVINGGQAPFRIRAVSALGFLTVGTVNSSGAFVPATSFNSEGYWVLNGRDPSFAIRVNNMSCGSNTSVLVLDGNSTPVNVTITTEEEDAGS